MQIPENILSLRDSGLSSRKPHGSSLVRGQALKWLVLLPLILSLGTPWAFLQSVAWFGMLVNYSRQTTFVEAVKNTFDGKHPCPLCKLVQQGQSEERQKKQSTPNQDDSLIFGMPPTSSLLLHPGATPLATARILPPPSRTDRPPAPPPRCA